MTTPGASGGVDASGSAVPPWIESFLTDPKRSDVLFKLARSGASERHAFVIADLAGSPWPVEAYLTDDLDLLPPTAPTLPAPVTGVWISHGLGSQGIRWDRTGWRLFKIRDETPPEPSQDAA